MEPSQPDVSRRYSHEATKGSRPGDRALQGAGQRQRAESRRTKAELGVVGAGTFLWYCGWPDMCGALVIN